MYLHEHVMYDVLLFWKGNFFLLLLLEFGNIFEQHFAFN